jgi:uncharacterized membrane protein
MLIKIDGVLMSAAPGEGSAGGSASTDAGAVGQESSNEESGNESGGESANGGQDAEGAESDDFANDFDFDTFLQYDPFANPTGAGKEAESGAEGEQGASQKAVGEEKAPEAGKTGQGDQGPQAGTGQELGQQVKDSPEMVLLRNQVQQLTQLLNQQQQQAAAQAGQAGQDSQPAGQKTPEQIQQERHQSVASKLPPYQFQIPQDILQKMGSDDPGQVTAGLQEFAKGVASVTHYNVAMQFEERIAELEKQILEKSVQTFKQTTQAESEQKKAQESVFNDFYTAFPELNKPELQLFVKMQAQQLAQQYGVQQWSKEFRDQLGTHVKKVLGMGVTQDPPSNGGTQTKETRKPGTRFNAGSGAGRQNGSNDVVDDIAATLLS